jgi:hypothetical protein
MAGDFPVRRSGVNRGGVSAGGERISPAGFSPTRASSHHLSLAQVRRKFPLASAGRAWLARNARTKHASSYRFYYVL